MLPSACGRGTYSQPVSSRPSQKWGIASGFNGQTHSKGKDKGLSEGEVTFAEHRPHACNTPLRLCSVLMLRAVSMELGLKDWSAFRREQEGSGNINIVKNSVGFV